MRTLEQERDKTEVLRRLGSLRTDSRRRWGRMSANQMVCHLADAFRVQLGRLDASTALNPFTRTILKWAALYLPVPWPTGIPTRPEMDQVRGGGTKPKDFPQDIAELERLLELVTAPGATFRPEGHPIFGKMSRTDWLRWGYLHVDHHLRQFGV